MSIDPSETADTQDQDTAVPEPTASAETTDPPPQEGTPPSWLELSLRWPAIFNIYHPRPLKIGIHDDLLQAGIDPAYVKRALIGYCRSYRYRRTLVEGAERIDLDGQPTGVVTAEQIPPAVTPRQRPVSPPKGQAAVSRRPIPQPLALAEEYIVTGRLDLTIKINEQPKAVPGPRDFTFGVDCDGTLIQVTVRPRLWNRLTQAAKDYPEWVANITGTMGPSTERGFVLLDPSIQVFEKKPKEAAKTAAESDSPPPTHESSTLSAVEEKVKAAAQDRGRAAIAAAAARRPKLTLSGGGKEPAGSNQQVSKRRW